MKNYFKFLLVAVMALSFGVAKAQTEKVVAIGDTVTLTSTNVGTNYVWSVSTDGKSFYVLPDETNRELKVRVFGANYYRVKWTNEEGKSYYADTVKVVTPEVNYLVQNYPVTAGQGYVEVDGTAGSGISIPQESRVSNSSDKLKVEKQLTNWTSFKAHAVYFFNTPAGVANLKMNITASKNSAIRFRMRIYDTDTPDSLVAENIISFNGTGSAQTIPVITCNLGKKGYNKYDLQCLNGNTSIKSINKWVFDVENKGDKSEGDVYSPTILMAPSIHIWGAKSTNPKYPTGSDPFDWAYEEAMIPRCDSVVDATYIMSLGILSGYMGIQVGDRGKARTVLFSQWDSGDTDTDPNLPDHLRSTAVDTGDSVVAQRFGGEGTGVQSFRNNGAFWDFGKYVQFISHCRGELATYDVVENGKVVTKQQRNVIVSAWWNAQDGKGWQYISTLRVANRESLISPWYSFVESYSNHNGQFKRHGYFRNWFAKQKDGDKKWFHINQIFFGHGNGGSQIGARHDIYQDVDPNDKYAWVMATGGFANKMHIGKESVPLRTSKAAGIDTINLDALLAREELALAKEQMRLDSLQKIKESMYDKSNWELVSFSSEETTGEGTNGRAAQILDGDNNTYWHSQWKTSTANPPHKFVVDMKEPLDINAFYFAMSGGEERFQKEITIEASNDNENWHMIYENKSCPTPKYGSKTGDYVLKMDSTVNTRYLRLTIKKVHTGVVFARINEFSPLLLPVGTSIDDVVENENKDIRIYSVAGCVYIDAPSFADYVTIDIYTTSGNKVVSRTIEDVDKGDVVSIHSFDIVPGVYVVRYATATGEVYNGKVVVK